MDAYDVTTTVLRPAALRRDGGGGFTGDGSGELVAVAGCEAVPARMHRYSAMSEWRQAVAVAGQGPGQTTRYRRFLTYTLPGPPLAVNDRIDVVAAGGEPMGRWLVLDVRRFQFRVQVDVEMVE